MKASLPGSAIEIWKYPATSASKCEGGFIRVKGKIAFALLMGIVTTGIVSFVLIALNLGFHRGLRLRGSDHGVRGTSSSYPPSSCSARGCKLGSTG